MEIVCNIDNSYIKHCVVMLTSLFENNRDECVTVHIISECLPEEGQRILKSLADRYHQSLYCYLVGAEILRDCPIDASRHFPLSVYYRLFLTSILPATLTKVLYLDCDLIVRKSLSELWNIDITDYPIACVEDMWSGIDYHYNRLHYASEYSYFNAGVLLINLAYWREFRLQQRCLDYIRQYPDRLHLYDQDVLNGVLYRKKLLLPFTWNMQDGFYRRKRLIRKDVWGELDRVMSDPAILHYTGRKKPWHYHSFHPFKSEYYKYLDLTIWQGARPPVNYWSLLNRRLKALLYFLKIEKPRYRKI